MPKRSVTILVYQRDIRLVVFQEGDKWREYEVRLYTSSWHRLIRLITSHQFEAQYGPVKQVFTVLPAYKALLNRLQKGKV